MEMVAAWATVKAGPLELEWAAVKVEAMAPAWELVWAGESEPVRAGNWATVSAAVSAMGWVGGSAEAMAAEWELVTAPGSVTVSDLKDLSSFADAARSSRVPEHKVQRSSPRIRWREVAPLL